MHFNSSIFLILLNKSKRKFLIFSSNNKIRLKINLKLSFIDIIIKSKIHSLTDIALTITRHIYPID